MRMYASFASQLPEELDSSILTVRSPHSALPEEYRVLEEFDHREIMASLTVNGQQPASCTVIELLLMQGFITPLKIQ